MKRILIIGTGSIGERHLRCFMNTGRAIAGIVEINAELRIAVAQRYGITVSHDSLEGALEGKWDAAVIAVPAQLHIPIAHKLADAGIPMLIEKPLSTTLQGIDELIRKVRDSGLPSAVAYVYRHHPLFEKLREMFHSGPFGRLLELIYVSGQNFPHYRPAYRDIYYARHETGGGALQDAMSHHLNLGEWLAGPIDRISVDASHQHLDGVQVEDTVHILARHGEVLASYSLNQYQPQPEQMLTLVCERGMLRAELHRNRLSWCSETEGPWHVQALAPLERDSWFTRQTVAFLDFLDGAREAACSLAEAFQTQKVICSALERIRSGQTLQRVASDENR